jgi:hypothetical protein
MARRALLIGINKYLIPGADLRGCVNDIQDLAGVLTQFGGFKKNEITTLADTAATQKAMVAGIKALVKDSKKGDVALLHYSGHGSHVPDDDKKRDETDGRDEILCPTDLNWDDPFRDDLLRDVFAKLRDGVRLTVIMDCCHSGTITRAVLPPDAPVKERFLPSPWDLAETESRRGLRRKLKSGLRTKRRNTREPSDIVVADIAEVLITGCRDTQTSADAFINGRYNGALTFGLVDAIKASRGRLTFRELHDRASAAIKRRRFEQVPQLEGMKARLDEPIFAN